jgi:hypothetical protein
VVELEPQRLNEAQRLSALLIANAGGSADLLLEAVAISEAASRVRGHNDPRALLAVGIAREAAEYYPEAKLAYERALEIARLVGDTATAFESDAHLRELARRR